MGVQAVEEIVKKVYGLIYGGIQNLFDISWETMQFGHYDFAIWAAAILIVALFLNRLYRVATDKKFYRAGSGYNIGWSVKSVTLLLLTAIPSIFLITGSVFALISLADPYLIFDEVKEVQKYRVQRTLFDVSSSMDTLVKLDGESITEEEALKRVYLNILVLRKDKRNKMALFVFANSAAHVINFTRSFENYFISVASTSFRYINFGIGDGTALERGLEAVIEDIKVDKESASVKTGLLIFSDGFINRRCDSQLAQLREMNVTSYLVYYYNPASLNSENYRRNELISDIENNGGYVFPTTGRRSEIKEIAEKIDRLETVDVEKKYYLRENYIYRHFLVIAFAFIFLAFIARFIISFATRTV